MNTTTISIERYSPATLGTERYAQADAGTRTNVATGIRAHLSSPSGQLVLSGGQQEEILWRLTADPCDLQFSDRVLDESTAEEFIVVWAHSRNGLGLDHVEAGLRYVVGEQ